MDNEHEHFEFDLALGDKLQIGDIVVTVMDTQDNKAAVLIENLNSAEEFDFEEPLTTTRPR